MMYWYGPNGWGIAAMALSMIVFWGLLITGVVLLVRWLSAERRPPVPAARADDPRRILAERYARGEIDEAEYRQRLKVLNGG
jgi:putative membrane protein